MNADSHNEKDDLLENQLRAQIRETTPEFEARFDELRRRLANEPVSKRSWFPMSWIGATVGLGAAAAVALMLLNWNGITEGPGSNLAAYGELVELNESLGAALVLVDIELRESVITMPLEGEVGS